MMIKASGRATVMVAVGLLVCLGGPLQATSAVARETRATAKHAHVGASASLKKFARHHKRHLTKHARAHKKSGQLASEARPQRHDVVFDIPEAQDSRSVLPPEVANANAQAAASDTANAWKPAMPSDAEPAQSPPAGAQNTGADELNADDLTLSPERPTTTPVAAPVSTTSAAAAGNDNTWSGATLLGKIFIAFGGLLTLASAARMFMA